MIPSEMSRLSIVSVDIDSAHYGAMCFRSGKGNQRTLLELGITCWKDCDLLLSGSSWPFSVWFILRSFVLLQMKAIGDSGCGRYDRCWEPVARTNINQKKKKSFESFGVRLSTSTNTRTHKLEMHSTMVSYQIAASWSASYIMPVIQQCYLCNLWIWPNPWQRLESHQLIFYFVSNVLLIILLISRKVWTIR